MYEESRHGTGKKIAWLTDMQMFKVFKDRVVVDELQTYCKENDGGDEGDLVRRHPQISHCARATHSATVTAFVRQALSLSGERCEPRGIGQTLTLSRKPGPSRAFTHTDY